MKKRQVTIKEYRSSSGAYNIIINNARYKKSFPKFFEKILKQLIIDDEVFLGFYRIDGINLTLEEQNFLKQEIPLFFKKNGEEQELNEYLTVARINSNNYDRSFILSIFDYYLETILFNPKIDWEAFKEYYFKYQENKTEDIILNHFAEVLFTYFDSGDFLICFNPQIYNSQEIMKTIKEFYSTGDGSVCSTGK